MTREEFTDKATAVRDDLRRFLLALCCGDAFRADDLAQDALLKAFLSIDSLRKGASFKSWIFTIANRLFIDSTRSKSPDSESLDTAAAVIGDSPEPMLYDHLYAALRRLSPAERSSIVLYYLEGYQIKEISALTGAGESAVKQQLSRGRQHLRTLLS